MNSVKIECKENNYNYYNSDANGGCHNSIELSNNNLFEVNDVGYFGETIERYYTVCPRCGNMVFIDDSILSVKMRYLAKNKNCENGYLFKENSLKARLIHLNYMNKSEVKKRVLK